MPAYVLHNTCALPAASPADLVRSYLDREADQQKQPSFHSPHSIY